MGNSLLMTLAMKPEEAHRYPQPLGLGSLPPSPSPTGDLGRGQEDGWVAELDVGCLAMGPLHYSRDIHSGTVNDHSIEPNELNTWVQSWKRDLSSVQFSRSVVSDSLRPHKLQHTRPPCPSPTPEVHSNSVSIESVIRLILRKQHYTFFSETFIACRLARTT